MSPVQRARHEREALFTLKKTPGAGFCGVKGCSKEGHRHKMGLCYAHYQYRWRMLHKKKGAYATLRDHAKERGIKFTISYDYWHGITDAYIRYQCDTLSGGDVLTIDRVDATLGYEPGNLTVLTMDENRMKGARERFLPAHIQHILERKRAKFMEPEFVEETESDDFPF